MKVIEVKLEELNASKGGASGGGGGGASTVAPTPAAPRAAPGHLQQLCDMGFARELAEEALVATGNDLSSAMEWMLSHQPSASGSSGREVVCVCVCRGGCTYGCYMWVCGCVHV